MARTKSSAPKISNPAQGKGSSRLTKGKAKKAAPAPACKTVAKSKHRSSEPDGSESERDSLPVSKKRRAVASPSPECPDDNDEPRPSTRRHCESPNVPSSCRASPRLHVLGIDPVEEDDEEEDDYGLNDHEGEELFEKEEGSDGAIPFFRDPEAAADNLIAALNGAKDMQRYLQHYKKIARVVPRIINPFLSIASSIECGLRIDPSLSYEEQDFAGIENMTEPLCREIHSFYERLTIMCPDLVKVMRLFVDDPSAFAELCKFMDKCANSAHRDDCSRLRHHVVLYIPGVEANVNKCDRGWYNRDTARLLCPQDMLDEFDQDWLSFAEAVRGGRKCICEYDLPSFLWDQSATDKDNLFAGLGRGPLLVKCFRSVFTGPWTGNKNEPGLEPGKACIMQKYSIVNVDWDMIAYISALVQFCLNSQGRWTRMDGDFDNSEFFLIVRDLFKDEGPFREKWAAETLEWWNLQVFCTKPEAIHKNPGNSVLGKLHSQLKVANERAAQELAYENAVQEIAEESELEYEEEDIAA